MNKNIVIQGIEWHYVDATRNILRGWRNFLLFNLEYFSVFLLIKTFFAPWRRYQWSYGRGFDLKVYVEAFFSNMISRILGAFMRSILICFGIISEAFYFFIGFIVLIIWLILPVLGIYALYHGIRLLF